MFPEGKEHSFTGEGEGNNYIDEYEWESHQWYRFLIHSWVEK